MKQATLRGFLIRFFGALALTCVAYNPSGYSVSHWLLNGSADVSVKVLVGITLLIGFAVYLAASYKAMGLIGMAVTAIFLATAAWVLVSLGWLTLSSTDHIQWLVLLALSAIMGVGLYWATIWKTLTGQVAVQETNNIEAV